VLSGNPVIVKDKAIRQEISLSLPMIDWERNTAALPAAAGARNAQKVNKKSHTSLHGFFINGKILFL
jgi:hypothetical protein